MQISGADYKLIVGQYSIHMLIGFAMRQVAALAATAHAVALLLTQTAVRGCANSHRMGSHQIVQGVLYASAAL
jgi:hypothetical protein